MTCPETLGHDDAVAWVRERDRAWAGEFARVELLCEIPVSEQEFEALSGALSLLARGFGADRFSRWAVNIATHALGVYLVGRGVRSYEAGDYWSAVRRDLGGLPQPSCQLLGEAFTRLLRAHGKPTFRDVPGHRFLKVILSHGGIPHYCRGDYFSLLDDAAFGNRWSGRSASELVSEWRVDSGSLFVHRDRPIERFLLYGGDVSAEFLDRSLEMAIRAREEGVVPLPEELLLPPDLVEAYRAWLQDRGEAPTGVARGAPQLRSLHPQLIYDPFAGVAFRLPDRVHDGGAATRISWELREGVERRSVELVPGRGTDAGWHTVRTSGPATGYEARDTDGRLRRFRGVDRDRPALFFAEDGRQLRDTGATLPRERIWILHRGEQVSVRDARGEPVPEGVVVRNTPFTGGWQGYRATLIDTSESAAHRVTLDDGQAAFPIEGPAPCRLAQEGRARWVYGPAGDPVYARRPDLIIPLERSTGTLRDLEASRWQVRIRTQMPTGEWVPVPLPASQGSMVTGLESLRVEVPAGLDPRLPNAGLFEIHARGPLGRQFRRRIVIAPDLQVDRPLEGRSAAEVTLPEGTKAELRFEGRAQLLGPLVRAGGWHTYTVEAGTGARRVGLRLWYAAAPDRQIHADIDLVVPGIRWALVLDRGAMEWGNEPIDVSSEELLRAGDPCLAVEAASDPWWASAGLSLWIDEDRLQHGGPRDMSYFEGVGRATLGIRPFLDTLRTEGLGRGVVHLDLSEPHDGSLRPASIPTLRVRGRWGAKPVSVTPCVDAADGQPTLHLAWEEPRRMRGRTARLWSLGRPWDPPVELRIPDDAIAQAELALDAPLPGGHYRVELSLSDAWTTGRSVRPACGAPGTLDACLGRYKPVPDGDQASPRSCLEGFLESAASGRPDWGALAPLRPRMEEEEGSREDLELAIRTHLAVVDGVGRVHEQFRREILGQMIRGRIGEALAVLAKVQRTMLERDRADLLALVLECDLVPLTLRRTRVHKSDLSAEVAEGLWALWRPLGLAADLPELRADDEAFRRVLGGLGVGSLHALSAVSKGSELTTADGRRFVVQGIGGDDLRCAQGYVPNLDVPGLWLEVREEAAEDAMVLTRTSDGAWRAEDGTTVGGLLVGDASMAISDGWGKRPTLQEARFPAAALRQQLEWLGPAPTDVLGEARYPHAHAQWLLRIAEDRALREELQSSILVCHGELGPWARRTLEEGRVREEVGEWLASRFALPAEIEVAPGLSIPRVSMLTALEAIWPALCRDPLMPHHRLTDTARSTCQRLMLEVAPEILELDLLRWIVFVSFHHGRITSKSHVDDAPHSEKGSTS